mmetsp:Transcript_10284/g.16357  ORF Transcript_10284/g.16357 Transcript_10284/m.16357 type:complete len:359 (+) Transcript_10284:725-1801(+)
MLLKVIRTNLAFSFFELAIKLCRGSPRDPCVWPPFRKKMKSVRCTPVHQSGGRGKVPSFIGITIGTEAFWKRGQEPPFCFNGGKPKCCRRSSILHLQKGLCSARFFIVLRRSCVVKPCSTVSNAFIECDWMSITACQSLELLGMHDGCKMKPARGILHLSLIIVATCATVKPKTNILTGFGPPWNENTCDKNVVELGKNSASEKASMASCMISLFDSNAHFAVRDCIRASVSPPLGRNWILPLDTFSFDLTKPFQRTSVQIVTNQPNCSAMPRAKATNGCTSPLVPLVIMNICFGYGCSFGDGIFGQLPGKDCSSISSSISQGILLFPQTGSQCLSHSISFNDNFSIASTKSIMHSPI